MIVGNPDIFAIESEISYAYARLSQLALGYFVLHVGGRCYGVKAHDATMLGVAFDQVEKRIAARGGHDAGVLSSADADEIAVGFRREVYMDEDRSGRYLGMSSTELTDRFSSHHLRWIGDEEFDDSSYIFQFDVENRVRLLAFCSEETSLVDAGSLRDVWIEADDFYGVLQEWHRRFEEEWASLPKFPETEYPIN
jgi:hypothetical protein